MILSWNYSLHGYKVLAVRSLSARFLEITEANRSTGEVFRRKVSRDRLIAASWPSAKRDRTRRRRDVASRSFEVHGPSARSPVARFATPEAAIVEASTRIFTNIASRTHALDRLKAGKNAHFQYGFSDVTIYVRTASRDRHRSRR